MSNYLSTLASYVPPSIARAIYLNPAKPSGPRIESFEAAVLFADISGFTALTEVLASKGPAGAEEITGLLNEYFGQMIRLVEADAGEVVQFSGDGLLVVFRAQDEPLSVATRRAFEVAHRMQIVSSFHFDERVVSGGQISLTVRIGIGAGGVTAMTVGGLADHWEYVVLGSAVQQAAAAELSAQVGEVVLSPAAVEIIARESPPPRPVAVLDWSQAPNEEAARASLGAYIPQAITYRLSVGQSAWLAELRRMSILFANIEGLDDHSGEVADQLHTFVRTAQEIINYYEGLINKISVDDKGTVLLALFGAPPHSHEDDPERATRCALDLQDAAARQGLELASGLTTGRVFAGPVGGPTRREYTVIGDKVNLASRLMSAVLEDGQVGQDAGRVLCDDDTFRAVGIHLLFDKPRPIPVKGKTGLVPVYSPLSDTSLLPPLEVHESQLIGREAELGVFAQLLDQVKEGQNRLLLLEGEAGIGKSRLVQEVIAILGQQGMPVLVGEGQSLEQQTPYRAWRDIFISYFGLDDFPAEALADKEARVKQRLAELEPAVAERAPLLNDVLGLALPESHLTRLMDADLRHQSLTALLITLLRRWSQAGPLALVFEDAHWLDSLSWELVLAVTQGLADQPLLMIIVMRPLDDESRRHRLAARIPEDLPGVKVMSLSSLQPQEVVALAAGRLGLAATDLPPEVAKLIEERSDGNPFFAEELIYALRDSGVIRVLGPGRCEIVGARSVAAVVLPETLQGVIVSRIDRLKPDTQLALKVAAVIGRTFSYRTLHDVLVTHTPISEKHLKANLEELVQLDLTPLEANIPELIYFFKHIITREVAYDLLLFAQRRDLHRTVAAWYERTFGDGPGLAPYYHLLVYHWRQADEQEKVRHYCQLAGQQAAARFANEEALAYLDEALALSEGEPAVRSELYSLREKIYDLLGEREKQGDDLAEMTMLAETLDNNDVRTQVFIRLAAYNEALSNYPAAIAAAQSALHLAQQTEDKNAEVKSLNQWGTALWMQGDLLKAREQFKRALSVLPPGDGQDFQHARATTLHNLGNIDHQLGDYPAALQSYEAALALRQAIGDSRGESGTLNNLGTVYRDQGDYSNALKHLDKALAINRKIGYLSGEAQCLHNLGAIYWDLGEYDTARTYYEQALASERTLGNRWGEAVNLTELGLIYHLTGDSRRAEEFCRQAQAIARRIGNPQVEGRATSLLALISEEQGELAPALENYTQALNLRLDTKQLALSVSDQAGLARCALARGELDEAYNYADNCATWLTVQGPVGLEDPLQVYVTCHRVFTATGHVEKARSILSYAYTTIQNRAAKIQDETLRTSFLTNIPHNRFILQAWDEYQALLADLDNDLDNENHRP